MAGSNQGISDAFAIGTDDLIHANAGRLAQARPLSVAAPAPRIHCDTRCWFESVVWSALNGPYFAPCRCTCQSLVGAGRSDPKQ